VNIRYDTAMNEFVAEFSSDFAGDLEAVKAAGFRTGGPPEWRWFAPSPGIKALNRLRSKRPASGLTITPEALLVYQPLADREAKNDEVKAALAAAKKQAKKEQKLKEDSIQDSRFANSECPLPDGRWWTVGPEDLPPSTYVPQSTAVTAAITVPPTMVCHICTQPVYFYELQAPPTCLFCEKNLLDIPVSL
jgi:hypothetical protein